MLIAWSVIFTDCRVDWVLPIFVAHMELLCVHERFWIFSGFPFAYNPPG